MADAARLALIACIAVTSAHGRRDLAIIRLRLFAVEIASGMALAPRSGA